jgi:hypothetical protein
MINALKCQRNRALWVGVEDGPKWRNFTREYRLFIDPTLPFTRDDMVRILGALDPYVERMADRGKENARRYASWCWCVDTVG